MPRISTYRLWLEYQSRHRTYERRVAPIFNRALKSQVQEAIAYMDKYGWETLEMMAPIVITPDVIRTAMRQSYRYIYSSAAGQEMLRLRREEQGLKAGIWETFRNIWRELADEFVLSELGQRITDITETTRRRIVEVIQRNRSKGGEDIGRRIRQELQESSFTRNRSVLIARTESTTAANEGHKTGAKQWAADAGVTLYKAWIATRDSRTRDAHRAMIDSQPILETDEFTVGGQLMDKPGDPKGGARNVCNCRCRVFYMSERKAIRDFGLKI